MVRTLCDVRLCCLDFLSRSMSSRPSSSSLVSMAPWIVPCPEQETDALNTWLCHCSYTQQPHLQLNPAKRYVKLNVIIKSPEADVFSSSCRSSQELSVSDVLSHLKKQVSSSVLRDLFCRGQMSSSAGRLRLVHCNTNRLNNQLITEEYPTGVCVGWGTNSKKFAFNSIIKYNYWIYI